MMGPSFKRGLQAIVLFGSPSPRIQIGNAYAAIAGRSAFLGSMQDVGTHAEARRTTPSGSSPVLVKRQSAIRSFRASATIMVFRVPGAFSVRKWNHWDKALSF